VADYPGLLEPALSSQRGLAGGRLYVSGLAAPRVSLASLEAYWPLDEESGDRRDLWGNGLLLTAVGAPPAGYGKIADPGPGIPGRAAKFLADSLQSLERASDSHLQFADEPFTLIAWVWLTLKNSQQLLVAKDTGAAGGREYNIQYNLASDRFRFEVSGDGTAVTSLDDSVLGSPSKGAWHLLVGWHDPVANTINLQIDGGTPSSTAHSAGCNAGSSKFTIGSGGASSLYASALIDEVSIWRRVLTSGERAALYNGGVGLAYPFPNVHYGDAPVRWLAPRPRF